MTGFLASDLGERSSESEGRIWRVCLNGRSNRQRFFGTVPVHLHIGVGSWLEAWGFWRITLFQGCPRKSVMR